MAAGCLEAGCQVKSSFIYKAHFHVAEPLQSAVQVRENKTNTLNYKGTPRVKIKQSARSISSGGVNTRAMIKTIDQIKMKQE